MITVTGADGTPIESTNLTQVAGAAIAQGHGVAATAIRVELPTDGTGVVALTPAQIATLTPPAAITGFALEAGHLATIDTSTASTAAVAGVTSGTGVITDANGTLQQYLRGIIKLAITAGGWLVTASLAAGTNLIGKVGIDQTTPGTTNAVALAQVGSTTVVNGGLAGTLAIGGPVATNVAINSNPLNTAAQGVSSENTAVTAGRLAQLVATLSGKLIVMPYANPENSVSGAITSAMTGTTSTLLLAAPGSGLRNYITQITISNAHATQGTDVVLQDGNGGTAFYTIPAAAAYGGAVLPFPFPLQQPSTNTAVYVANVTTGASTKASGSGFKGA